MTYNRLPRKINTDQKIVKIEQHNCRSVQADLGILLLPNTGKFLIAGAWKAISDVCTKMKGNLSSRQEAGGGALEDLVLATAASDMLACRLITKPY